MFESMADYVRRTGRKLGLFEHPADALMISPEDLTRGGVPPGITDPSFMQGLTGYTLPDGTKIAGWGGLALGALQGVGNIWSGMQQYGVAKDALRQQRREFDANFGAQRNLINSQLEDRQRARVAANPGAHIPVDQYMSTYRVR